MPKTFSTMTNNKQLATEKCDCQECPKYNDVLRRCRDDCHCSRYYDILETAYYKDSLFKTELNRLRNRFYGEESQRAYFALETLDELYNNLFPNE